MRLLHLSQAIDGFAVSFLADGRAEVTLTNYRYFLSRLVQFLDDPEVHKVSHHDLQAYLAWLRMEYKPHRMSGDTAPLTNSSLAKAWAALRSFWRWSASEFNLKKNPADGLSMPQSAPKAVIPFTEDEIRRLLKAAEFSQDAKTHGRKSYSFRRVTADRDLALIVFLLDTGARIGEVSRLTIGDIDLTAGIVEVRPIGSGHKSRGRILRLGKSARKYLWRYLSGRDDALGTAGDKAAPLFLSVKGQALNRNSAHTLLSRLGKRAGISGTHPHRFRHTFAITFLRNGGGLLELQELLGHSDIQMVKHYARLAEVDLADAHRRASPADKWRL
jgi:integrase/recombinase XerD